MKAVTSQPAITKALPRRRKILNGCFCALLLFVALTFIFHQSILRAAARAWIIDDTPVAADVIILPGGQIATRPPKAAQLYLGGWAPTIFVMRESANPILHADTPGGERALYVANYFKKEGVGAEAIIFSEDFVHSTWEEAEQFSRWIDSLAPEKRPQHAIIVTDAFHSRRARWSFQRHTKGISYSVIIVPHRKYELDSWWKSEFGRDDFRSEIGKFFLYLFR